jgi:hypothetical protein
MPTKSESTAEIRVREVRSDRRSMGKHSDCGRHFVKTMSGAPLTSAIVAIYRVERTGSMQYNR